MKDCDTGVKEGREGELGMSLQSGLGLVVSEVVGEGAADAKLTCA